MVINGSNRLACKVLLKSLGKHVALEAVRGFRVIKDLLVDMDAFLAKYRSVKPYFITHSPEPERRKDCNGQLRQTCAVPVPLGACTTSCLSFWANQAFHGGHRQCAPLHLR